MSRCIPDKDRILPLKVLNLLVKQTMICGKTRQENQLWPDSPNNEYLRRPLPVLSPSWVISSANCLLPYQARHGELRPR